MAHSHSSMALFETCPKQYEHTYILKDIPRGVTEATEWGTKIHRELEMYALAGVPVQSDISRLGVGIIDASRGFDDQVVEWQFGLDENFRLVDFKDPQAMLRGVVDFAVFKKEKALLVDWKTGKPKDDFKQMGIFTLAVFARNAEVERVKAAYVWLKFGTVSEHVFCRDDVVKLEDTVLSRIYTLDEHIAARNFPMKTSGLCHGWCPVKSCPAWKEKNDSRG